MERIWKQIVVKLFKLAMSKVNSYNFVILDLVKRTDSIQSRRKVSSLSDRSDTSEPGAQSGGEESPGILR